METKTVSGLEIKADAAQGLVTAYASTFGNIDSYGDTIYPGAFRKTVAERGGKVRVLRDHDSTRVVGKAQHMEEDGTGLLTVSKLVKTPLGEETLILLQEGAIDELSIGYSTVQGTKNEHGGRDLRELKLYEYSFLPMAADSFATVQSIKSMGGLETEIRRWQAIAELDLKAGRVLSRQNVARIIQALSNLEDVLSAAGVDEEAAEGTSPTTTAEKSTEEPPEHSELLTELKAFKPLAQLTDEAAILAELKTAFAPITGA